LWQSADETGSNKAHVLAGLLERASRIHDAIEAWEPAAERGSAVAMYMLAVRSFGKPGAAA